MSVLQLNNYLTTPDKQFGFNSKHSTDNGISSYKSVIKGRPTWILFQFLFLMEKSILYAVSIFYAVSQFFNFF